MAAGSSKKESQQGFGLGIFLTPRRAAGCGLTIVSLSLSFPLYLVASFFTSCLLAARLLVWVYVLHTILWSFGLLHLVWAGQRLKGCRGKSDLSPYFPGADARTHTVQGVPSPLSLSFFFFFFFFSFCQGRARRRRAGLGREALLSLPRAHQKLGLAPAPLTRQIRAIN
jgi:hypothetical protein